MSEQFKIITQFVKDMSCETPDVETYLYVKEYLKNYNLDILKKPRLFVLTKIDTHTTMSHESFSDFLKISSVSGEGLGNLIKTVATFFNK